MDLEFVFDAGTNTPRARDAMLAATDTKHAPHGILFALMTRKELGSIAFLTCLGLIPYGQSSAGKR